MTKRDAIHVALGLAAAAGTVAVAATAMRKPPQYVTLAELTEMTPRLTDAQRRLYLPRLNEALHEWGLTTPNRIAHALGQWLHESWQFSAFVEIGPDVQRYANNPHLGNGGDASKAASYIGRGPTQLTGLSNYTRAGKRLGLDLVNYPELAADHTHGFRIAAWYFREGNGDLALLADKGVGVEDVLAVTKRINGGTNGLGDRQKYTAQVVGILARRGNKA